MGNEGTQSHRFVTDGRVGPTIIVKKREKHRCIDAVYYGRRIRCTCGSAIVVKTSGEEMIVKTRVLRVNEASNEVTAKCANCKRWVKVPLICTI